MAGRYAELKRFTRVKVVNCILFRGLRVSLIGRRNQIAKYTRIKYTLRQKFTIIICVKEGKNIWLELIILNKYFDTIVPIRCHGYGGNNQDFFGLKIGK